MTSHSLDGDYPDGRDMDTRAFARWVHEHVLNPLHLLVLADGRPLSYQTLLVGLTDPTPVELPGDLLVLLGRVIGRAHTDVVQAEVWCPPGIQVPGGGRGPLLDAAREAVRNAQRHADATTIQVHGKAIDEGFEVCVIDDGRGIDPLAVPRFGLTRAITEAMASVGGTAEVTSMPFEGTKVRLVLPARPATAMTQARYRLEQWPMLIEPTTRLLTRLIAGDVDATDPSIRMIARIEDGRIRTWLSCLHLHSWLAEAVFDRVAQAADAGYLLPAVIMGEGGISEASSESLLAVIDRASSVTLSVGAASEELLLVVQGRDRPRIDTPPGVQVELSDIAERQWLVRILRSS